MAGLAVASMSGRGMDRDPAAAAMWWRRAADHGSALAMVMTSAHFEMGHGVPQDRVAAEQWYVKAVYHQTPAMTALAHSP